MSLFVVNTLFRLRDLKIFRILFTEALLRCRAVALSHCRIEIVAKQKIFGVPSSVG